MKTLKLTAVIASVLFAASASAVDFSTTYTQSTTNAVTDVNQKISGYQNGIEVNYSQNRGPAAGGVNGNGCIGAVCDGTGNDTLSVGITIEAVKTTTKIDQLTTGFNATTTEACDVTVSIGGISNSQGVREAASVSERVTQNNNLTIIDSAKVEVVTQTDVGYLNNGASKPGNDFNLVFNGTSTNSEGAGLPLMHVGEVLLNTDASEIRITGQDLAIADTNAISVTFEEGRIKVVDTSVTTVETESKSTTWYENN